MALIGLDFESATQAGDSGNGHPSVIAVLPTAPSAVLSGESFLGPATCDGLLTVKPGMDIRSDQHVQDRVTDSEVSTGG